MKNTLIVVAAYAALAAPTANASSQADWNDNFNTSYDFNQAHDIIQITPSPLTDTDQITFDVNGNFNSGGWIIDFTEVFIDHGTLQLTINASHDGSVTFPAVTPWDITESLHPLKSNDYDLLVVLTKTSPGQSTTQGFRGTFTVIPEPASLSLLTLGTLGTLALLKRKK